MIDFQLTLYLLGTLVLLLWVTFPMLAAGAGRRHSSTDAAFAERKEGLLNSLRELYVKHEGGHISADDLPNIERRLILDLARLYHDSGQDPEKKPDESVIPVESQPTCAHCGSTRQDHFKFCPACGDRAA